MSDESRLFEQKAIWRGGKAGEVVSAGMPAILTDGQIQSGSIRHHTPEDLLVAAVAACFMNSFIIFTEKMRIDVKSFEVEGQGLLEKVDRSFEITRITLRSRVTIGNEDIRGKVERALELGGKYCFVANSLKASFEHHDEIIVKAD